MRGILKSQAEDFIVEEIPKIISREEDGKYTILKVRLTNWDTNRFLIYLARYLGISKKRITYCGTKDKRGVTTQYFCLNHDFDPSGINIGDCEVIESFRSNQILGLGDLLGNRFIIDLKIDDPDIATVRSTYDELNAKGGFPNFFGLQRFGSLRTNTHKIGRLLTMGEYEEAARMYIYDPEFDTEDYRINFARNNDPVAAMKEFPETLNFERSLLGYMIQHGNLKEAFSVFPKNLSMIFIHAYQSYIFNRILSMRMRIAESMNQIFPGDTVMPVDYLFNPDKRQEISVNSVNLEKIQGMVNSDRLRPTIPIFGYETDISRGEPGELEAQILGEEKLHTGMFRLPGYPDLSSRGERRIISVKPLNFSLAGGGILDFQLGRGIYATSLIREFLKENGS